MSDETLAERQKRINRKINRQIALIVGVASLIVVAASAAVVIPNVIRNAELSEACVEIGAEPVWVRAWVQMCERPDGVIIRNPVW